MNKITNCLSIICRSIKKRGLKQTFLFLVGEYWFDIRFQVNTRPHLLNSDNSIVGGNLDAAESHYGTNWFVLKSIFQDLIRKNIVTPQKSHLVDFGCGAGRVLMAAQLFGISKVTVVEFSKNLCLRAEENLHKFAHVNFKHFTSFWGVLHADACYYSIPHDATLFFLYNPFGSPVINVVAQHIVEFSNSVNHDVKIIYVNPVHALVFEQLGCIKLQTSSKEVAIYACR